MLSFMQHGTPHRRAADSDSPIALDPRERAALAEAEAQLAAGQWTIACKLFHALAVSPPQRRDYRARMHYTRGREYLAARQFRNARSELRQAIELDPELTAAVDALAQATTLLSKLFRR